MAGRSTRQLGGSAAVETEPCGPCRAGGNRALNHRVKDFTDDETLRAHLREQYPNENEWAMAATLRMVAEFRQRWQRQVNVVDLDSRRWP